MTKASYLDDLCGSIAGLKRLENGQWAHLKEDESIFCMNEEGTFWPILDRIQWNRDGKIAIDFTAEHEFAVGVPRA